MANIRLAVYSAAHLLVDLSCALLLLGRVCPQTDPAICLLLYNFFAFAVQMPLAFWPTDWAGAVHCPLLGVC